MRQRRTCAVTVITALLVMLAGSPASAAPKKDGPSSTGGRCNPRKTVCVDDTTGESVDGSAPTISVTTPTSDATVSGIVSVTGSAADDVGIATVEVQVDGGVWTAASGTTSWTHELDTSALDDGAHTIAARVTDTSGNATTAATAVTVSNGSVPAGADWVLADPSASHTLLPLGRTRLASWGSLTGVLYIEQFTNRRAIAFRDAEAGTTSYVDLPSDSLAGWTSAATVMTSARDLWVFGGNGPLRARHYRFDDAAMPTSATLVEARTFGDGDSREGDMLALTSGGIVITWHQQGSSGPQGQLIAYRSPAGEWQELPSLTFMPTAASDQVLGQHPSDGSIWLFSNPDAWGAIGAVHLTEANGSLRVDWTDGSYITTTEHGLNGPDPENPNLAIAPDTHNASLALAYQSADRKRFSNGTTTAIGSRIAIATIKPSGVESFLVLPVWAERVSAVGLVVSAGEVAVSHQPIDEVTLSFSEVHVSRHRDGGWQTPTIFGSMASTDRVTYAAGRFELSTRLDDGKIHLRTF